MATIYKRQSKEALVHLCEQRGIDPADKSKELLVCALMEQDAEQGSGTAQGSQDMDINPGRVSPEATHSRSPQEGMDVSLQMALQQLGECDPSLRLQLILQFNQAAAAREERAAREKERAAAEREERAAAEREERAAAEREERAAAEREERAAAEREERAAAERQADREFRLEMARIERGINSVQPQSQDVDPKRPRQERFPVLDKDGDLDIFLRSFEKTCRQYHLPREQWAQYLSPGLRGKALEVFADLPLELDEDYDAIKAALIKKYNLTPEVYRKKFRSVKRETTESYADTVGNLRTTFLQWTRGLSVNSREDLEDLMIKDQFLHICPVDVRQFVCDREPKTADEAAQIADSYTANRMPEAKRETSPQRSTSWKEKQARTTSQPSVSKVGENLTLRESINQGDMRKCFNCNKVGHLRSACPERGATVYSTVPVVMLLSGDMDKLQHHMQTVIVGDRVIQGLRDSGASYSLVRPEVINPEDIIPEKTLPVKGITGCHPGVPVAKVFMDWGSGRGIRQVGVSQELPVDVLLGNDLGKMTTVYVPDVQQSYEKMGRSPRGLIWEGGQDSKSKAMPAPEPEVSQYEEATGEGVVNGPPEITLQSADMVKGVRGCQDGVSESAPRSSKVLSVDLVEAITQGEVLEQTRGVKMSKAQSMSHKDASTQTGEMQCVYEPKTACTLETVLREETGVHSEVRFPVMSVASAVLGSDQEVAQGHRDSQESVQSVVQPKPCSINDKERDSNSCTAGKPKHNVTGYSSPTLNSIGISSSRERVKRFTLGRGDTELSVSAAQSHKVSRGSQHSSVQVTRGDSTWPYTRGKGPDG
ncbi:uncharacterized protein [Engystomops pustulosus]|uniref:uncharacterized protein n=1 Tax=Engystomops pustulosus TaxID=76066 RepID=UPI003AFABB84